MRILRWTLAALIGVAACGDDGGQADGDGVPVDGGRRDADGAPEHDADPGGGLVTITTYEGTVQAPVEWIAVQDGDGAWTELQSGDGIYQFEARSGRYGVAHVCANVASTRLRFFYATRQEATELVRSCEPSDDEAYPMGTVRLTVTGLEGETSAHATAGYYAGAGGGADLSPSEPVGDIAASPGVHDLVLAVHGTTAWLVDRHAIVRDIEVVEGQTTELAIDALAGTSPATTHSVDLQGALPGASIRGFLWFITKNGRHNDAWTMPIPPTSYSAMSDAELEPDELHHMDIRVFTEEDSIDIHHFFHSGEDIQLTVPPPFPSTVEVESDLPYPRLRATFDAPEDASAYVLRAVAFDRHFDCEMTAAYLGDGAAATWVQPDFTDLPGWKAQWAFSDNFEITAQLLVIRAEGDEPLATSYFPGYPDLEPPVDGAWDGATVTRAWRTHYLTP